MVPLRLACRVPSQHTVIYLFHRSDFHALKLANKHLIVLILNFPYTDMIYAYCVGAAIHTRVAQQIRSVMKTLKEYRATHGGKSFKSSYNSLELLSEKDRN